MPVPLDDRCAVVRCRRAHEVSLCLLGQPVALVCQIHHDEIEARPDGWRLHAAWNKPLKLYPPGVSIPDR